MNLLEIIKRGSQPEQQQMTDESGKLATLLRARSGKQVAGPDIAASNLGEASAVSQTNQQISNVQAPAATRQNEALAIESAGLAQREAQQAGDIAHARKANTIQSQIQTNELLQSLEQGRGKLDLEKEKAGYDQIAVNLRMNTQKYVDDLRRIGEERRLTDDIEFQKELQKTTFGDAERIAEQVLKGKSVLSSNDREFNKTISQMSTDQAWDMFNADMAAAKKQANWASIGGLAQAGIGAYGTSQDNASRKEYYNSSAGKKDTSYDAYKARKS